VTEIKQWQDHQGQVLDSVNGFDVIDCTLCGFKHAIPLPTPDELEQIYRHEYYTAEKPLYLERAREDIDWWNLVYSDRYDSFESLLPMGHRRLLDIGSGPGFFLLHGQNRGWQVRGIEPSARAAAHARGLGLDVVEDFLDEASSQSLGRFDVVHLSEVLEHIPDPARLMKIARSLLIPDGLLCAVTPNDYNAFQHTLRTACGFPPWWVAPPHHLNYFDFDSLSMLFESTGLEVVSREATFPIDLFLLMGDNYVGNDQLGRACHEKRKTMEQSLAKAGLNSVKRNLYRCLANAGIGREACIIGRAIDS